MAERRQETEYIALDMHHNIVFDSCRAEVPACSLQGWVAVIVFVTVASYLPLTVIVTEWRGRVRKKMNAMDNAMGARATDMLLNYETVRSTVQCTPAVPELESRAPSL